MELYIHVPFCKKKCLYCDFLSWDNHEEYIDEYISALIEDIKCSLDGNTLTSGPYDTGRKIGLESIYIGGGTPSFIDSKYIKLILSTVKSYSSIADNAEITIELNPCTVTEEKAKSYLEAGINRVSMGVQSLDNSELKLLGRVHNEADVYKAYSILRKTGFNNISMDLIQALPGQSTEAFMSSLDKAIRLAPEHISAYGLIIEPVTPFYDRYSEESGYEFDEEVQTEMYIETIKRLEKAGYMQYEISNYAKEGFFSVHNTGYWTGKEYLGCGLGAVSYLGNKRVVKCKNLKEYITNPNKVEIEYISIGDKKKEFIFLGMRMKKGINTQIYEERFAEPFPMEYKRIFERYMPEYIIKEENNFRFTTKGFLISNVILSEFI